MRSIVFGMLMVAAMPVMADDEKAEKSESKTVAFSEPTDAPLEGGPAVAMAGRRVLGDREARKFGISIKSVLATHKELKTSGVIDGTESTSERAIIVGEAIATKAENKAAYAKAGAGDWERIFALIEKIISFLERFNLI